MRSRIAVLASGGGSNLQAILDHFDRLGERRARRRRRSWRAIDATPARSTARCARGIPLARARDARRDPTARRSARCSTSIASISSCSPATCGSCPRDVVAQLSRAHHQRASRAAAGVRRPGHVRTRACITRCIESGARVTGVTVHFVDETYDRGRIIAQWPVPVFQATTPETLAARVLRVEHMLVSACRRRRRRRHGPRSTNCADRPSVPIVDARPAFTLLPHEESRLAENIELTLGCSCASTSTNALAHPASPIASPLPCVPHAYARLLSVSDKTGLVDFARGLAALGWELVSTGGTARALRDAGLPVRDVERAHRFPGDAGRPREDAASRRCTAGCSRGATCPSTWRRSPSTDRADRPRRGEPLSVPRDRRAQGRHAETTSIEKIDIGGPCMLRSAAKNFASVWVVVDPDDYARVLAALRRERRRPRPAPAARGEGVRAHRGVRRRDRRRGSRRSAATSSRRRSSSRSSARRRCATARIRARRAAFYVERPGAGLGGARAARRQGAVVQQPARPRGRAARHRPVRAARPACAIVKHTTPCGLADRRDAARRVPEGARVRPGVGVRLGDRVHRAGRRRDRGRGVEPVRRVHRRAVVQPTAPSRSSAARRTCACSRARRAWDATHAPRLQARARRRARAGARAGRHRRRRRGRS